MNRRVPAVLVVLASVVAVVLVDHGSRSQPTPVFSALARPTLPFVPSGSFITSSWFCPGVPVGAGKGGSVVVANPGDVPIRGRVTVFTDAADTASISRRFEVAARGTESIDIAAVQPTGTFASAVVEVDGGGGFVEQEARHPAGNAVAPCSNSTSAEWYLADGYTLDKSTEELVVTNPFPDDAILEFQFATSEGIRKPIRLQGFPVRGNSIAIVPQTFLPADEVVLAVKVAATRGRVVLGRSQAYGGERNGYTMNLGAPSLGPQFYFADGEVGPNIIERYSIYNGSDKDVTVNATFLGIFSDTFDNDTEITVPAGRVGTLNTADVEGLPAGRHGVVFETTNAGSIVVERAITRPTPDGGRATTVVMGAPAAFASTRWSMAVGTDLAVDDVLVVLNVSPSAATISVKALGPGGEAVVPGMATIAIEAGAVLAIPVTDQTALGRPLFVESSAPLVVERLLPRNATLRGRSGSLAMPG